MKDLPISQYSRYDYKTYICECRSCKVPMTQISTKSDWGIQSFGNFLNFSIFDLICIFLTEACSFEQIHISTLWCTCTPNIKTVGAAVLEFLMWTDGRTYIHTDIHTYIHTYIQTFFPPISIPSIAILHMAVWKLKINQIWLGNPEFWQFSGF